MSTLPTDKQQAIRKMLNDRYHITPERYAAMTLEEKRNLLIELRKHTVVPFFKIEEALNSALV